jgi:hypothetical protein
MTHLSPAGSFSNRVFSSAFGPLSMSLVARAVVLENLGAGGPGSGSQNVESNRRGENRWNSTVLCLNRYLG